MGRNEILKFVISSFILQFMLVTFFTLGTSGMSLQNDSTAEYLIHQRIGYFNATASNSLDYNESLATEILTPQDRIVYALEQIFAIPYYISHLIGLILTYAFGAFTIFTYLGQFGALSFLAGALFSIWQILTLYYLIRLVKG